VSPDQVAQMAGALLILVGFILSQRNLLDADSYLYLILNLVGATILVVLAFQMQRWGFVLLEGVWALVALVGVILRLVRKEPTATPARPQS
jgi:membrane-bound ClpP family serine protease